MDVNRYLAWRGKDGQWKMANEESIHQELLEAEEIIEFERNTVGDMYEQVLTLWEPVKSDWPSTVYLNPRWRNENQDVTVAS